MTPTLQVTMALRLYCQAPKFADGTVVVCQHDLRGWKGRSGTVLALNARSPRGSRGLFYLTEYPEAGVVIYSA